jgi:radical SAM protein with 4Fe4S-binding SPASM domain
LAATKNKVGAMDKFRIDSHKLLFHPKTVSNWLEGKNIAPIYMEISPMGACNHRCVFCGLDFMGYHPNKLDLGLLSKRLPEMKLYGVKSIMYAGEGEPFLHKDFCEIVRQTKAVGIDVAITTNGVLMTPDKIEKILPDCSWIKVSFNAGNADTYAKIHQTKAEDFSKVIENMRYAAQLKKGKSYKCTLGLQMILLPDNFAEAEEFVKIGKDAGMDYVVIKPYSQHPLSETRIYKEIKYTDQLELGKKLEEYSDENFAVVFRANAMQRWDEKCKSYDKCLALPFWSYIDAEGNVWGCSMFLGDEHFLYGNIKENTFQEIWESEKRRKSLEYVANDLDTSICRVNCRMDAINEYLDELKHPKDHVNFI